MGLIKKILLVMTISLAQSCGIGEAGSRLQTGSSSNFTCLLAIHKRFETDGASSSLTELGHNLDAKFMSLTDFSVDQLIFLGGSINFFMSANPQNLILVDPRGITEKFNELRRGLSTVKETTEIPTSSNITDGTYEFLAVPHKKKLALISWPSTSSPLASLRKTYLTRRYLKGQDYPIVGFEVAHGKITKNLTFRPVKRRYGGRYATPSNPENWDEFYPRFNY